MVTRTFFVVVEQAEDVFLEGPVFRDAQVGEYHRDAEDDEAEAADGGDDVFSVGDGRNVLEFVEDGVEFLFMVGLELECRLGGVEQRFAEVVEFAAEVGEVFVKRAFRVFGKDVVPDEPYGKLIEDDAAEEAVFGVGDEVLDLARGTGEERGEAGGLMFRYSRSLRRQ